VLNGVAPIPWLVATAGEELIGQPPSQALFEQVTETALAGARPLAQNGYKMPIAKALIRRSLASVTGLQQGT
jgi:xanthine dehydrogenase YagS FAD-binding subunit